MKHNGPQDMDGVDSAQMCAYMEARIQALRKRLRELEAENAALRLRHMAEHSDLTQIASA